MEEENRSKGVTMANCRFALEISGDPAQWVQKMQETIARTRGQWSGDGEVGEIILTLPIGTIRGRYAVTGNRVEIEITEKPLLLSCRMIESELRKYR